MGLKKYEIITVGSDKRVRALRSWQVGDRYVNIGDVGGIVYDEKTLSQDGLCWLFRGNFGFPGARIGGDSIVDVGEATLSTAGSPAVDILGSSVVVGSKLQFDSIQTAADAVVLTAADFEQGGFGYSNPIGTNWENWKVVSLNYVRTVKPIFAGGAPMTLKLDVPGYILNWFTLDRDGNVIATGGDINSGEGVTTVVPACHSFVFRLTKNPVAATVPADATAAQITFTGTYETKLSVIDSRVEINPATSTGITTIRPGGTYTVTSGAKYPEAVIRNSNVSINVSAVTSRLCWVLGQIIESNATLDATGGTVELVGRYRNVKNLRVSGVPLAHTDVSAYSIIQATDCNDFAVSPTIFPGLADAQTANMPFIFQGCNVPNGRFYHHAQIANTYKNIDFAKAQADLGKSLAGGGIFASAEVEGMYRLATGAGGLIGSLVESHNSVANLSFSNFATIYGTTIYKDAYLSGLFDFAGTNVFGNTMKHDASNTQNVMAVQGIFNEIATGKTITGIVSSPTLVCVPTPFRINGAKGLKVNNMPAGLELIIFAVNANNKITRVQGSTTVNTELNGVALADCKAFIRFKKVNGDPITPDDVKGVTITTYNGCKIVNTGVTAVPMKGNVRVEDNATLIDTSVTGTGYFGGNSIAQGLTVEGTVYMKDNAVFAPTTSGTPKANILQMTDNASFTGAFSVVGARLTMFGNAQFRSRVNYATTGFVTMRDNADISGSGSVAVLGALVLQDDASITAGAASISGNITLCGKYTQTASKTWTGKRVIDSQDAPEYDNNVKTKYDF